MTAAVDTNMYTPVDTVAAVVAEARDGFTMRVREYGMNSAAELEMRAAEIRRIRSLVADNADVLIEGWRRDTGVHATFGKRVLDGCLTSCDYLLENMVAFSKGVALGEHTGGACHTLLQPRGVVLVFQTWNFALPLAIKPLVTAIAAGNNVVLKLSEVAEHFNAVFLPLLQRCLGPDFVRVIYGAADIATEVLRCPFDLIFYTGNTVVGKIVMTAAAKNLTPCVLELGGKNPVVVTASANIKTAARKIIDGRMKNAGQFCVAPDYVFVDEGVKDELVAALVDAVNEFFTVDPKASSSYANIINERHTRRIQDLLSGRHGGTVACGGTVDVAKRYIAPTVIIDPDRNSTLMEDEIFGPVLSVVGVDSIDDAISEINARPPPLALYIFAGNDGEVQQVISRTQSGGVCVNDVIKQMLNETLPFGGVGSSGMGNYHGFYGFRQFSHERALMQFSHKHTGSGFPPY